MGKMHGSSWWIGSCVVKLIDLIWASSAGEIGPLSFCSLRRTSFSSAALSVKSTLAGCALQSDALFFTNAGGGGGRGGGGADGEGAGATAAAASGGEASFAFVSSHATASPRS